MTTQSMEKLIFNGKEIHMASEPLASYLSNLKEKPKLFPPSSGCWRGYYGKWEINDDRLYLIDLECYTANMEERTYRKVGLDFIFPNEERVFAEWFTGEIRIPQGEMLNYVHGGFDSIYELDLFLELRNGHLIGKRTVDNLLRLSEALMDMNNKIPSNRISFSTMILDTLKKINYSFFNRIHNHK